MNLYDPADCTCNRPKHNYTCSNCQIKLVNRRLRQRCSRHPKTSYLSDLDKCPGCSGPVEDLRVDLPRPEFHAPENRLPTKSVPNVVFTTTPSPGLVQQLITEKIKIKVQKTEEVLFNVCDKETGKDLATLGDPPSLDELPKLEHKYIKRVPLAPIQDNQQLELYVATNDTRLAKLEPKLEYVGAGPDPESKAEADEDGPKQEPVGLSNLCGYGEKTEFRNTISSGDLAGVGLKTLTLVGEELQNIDSVDNVGIAGNVDSMVEVQIERTENPDSVDNVGITGTAPSVKEVEVYRAQNPIQSSAPQQPACLTFLQFLRKLGFDTVTPSINQRRLLKIAYLCSKRGIDLKIQDGMKMIFEIKENDSKKVVHTFEGHGESGTEKEALDDVKAKLEKYILTYTPPAQN